MHHPLDLRPREVLYLIGPGGSVLYREHSNSPSELVDTRGRWEAIWKHRIELVEIAHSHPQGPLAFSKTDLETMKAVELGVGRTILWSILAYQTHQHLSLLRRQGNTTWVVTELPAWAHRMHSDSNMRSPPSSSGRDIEGGYDHGST